MFECHPHRVRATLKRWVDWGLGGLWEASGRGAKAKWQVADLEYLERCIEDDTRTYNSVQLAAKLKQERAVTLSSDRLRRLLKKKGIGGNALVKVIATSKTPFKKPSSKQT
jgi:transposase